MKDGSKIINQFTHSCQDMTRPPRILAGVFSAAKTGDVVALGPIPKPSNRRQTCCPVYIFFSQRKHKQIGGLDVQKAEAMSVQILDR